MDVHQVHHLKMYVVSVILSVVIRRTRLSAGSQTLGEEGDKGDNEGNGEFHDVDFLVV
jgi:hypothetical protein